MEHIHGVLRKRLPTFMFRKVYWLLYNAGPSRPTDVDERQGRTQDHNVHETPRPLLEYREEIPTKREPVIPDSPVTPLDLRHETQENIAHGPTTDFKIISEAMDRLMLEPGEVILLNEGGTKRIVWLLKQRLTDVMNEVRNRTESMKAFAKQSRILESRYQRGEERVERLVDQYNDDLTQEEKNELDQECQEMEDSNNQVLRQREVMERTLSALEAEQSAAYHKIFLSIEYALEDTGLLTPIPVISDDIEDRNAEDEHPVRTSRPLSHKSSSVAVSNEQLFRNAAVNKLGDLERALHHAESLFEDRDDAYEMHYQAWNQARQDGNCSRTLTDVDVEYVREISKRARRLREAEEAYDKAVLTARLLKVLPVQFDRESNFVSGSDDGYRESADAELCATVDKAFIQRWADEVAEMTNSGAHTSDIGDSEPDDELAAEADEWDVRSVGLSDSVSVVDFSRNRKRIDAWRKICGW
ncbi:hypothetical protein MMC30_005705 [Trapelia coarctata]|nr:hypothetical protein [Trapelia coarctata]